MKKGETASSLYPLLIKKAKKSDHLHFSVDNGSLIVKEKASSSTALHKIVFGKMTGITIIGGETAIGFEYLQEAWVMVADNVADLTNWAKSIIHLAEEAAKQHEAVTFPEFEATESGLTADIEFTTDQISYDYKPLVYKKKKATSVKVFDLSEINVDEEPTGPAPATPSEKPVLKKERSVEILSDDD